MPFQKATTTDELWSGEMTGLSIGGQPILLVNIDGVVRAYADWCPHQRSRLSVGSLADRVLICASHHWQFDAVTGRGINPKDACLTPIAVRVAEGQILVDVSEAKDISGTDRHEGES
jgi:toluene monooxygenase system ferredoxin subunit